MFKKIITLCVLALSACQLMSAQDIITKMNGEEIEAIVVAVNSNHVSYKSFSRPNGPLYAIPVADVSMIEYENGVKDVFNGEKHEAQFSYYPDIAPGMKYKDLKEIYDYRMYTPDFFEYRNPAWCGIGSFFIPGLGQMCCGEWGRGLAFLGANIGLSILNQEADTPLFFLGQVAVNIWSIVDAVRVAKVTNMYVSDLRRMANVDFNVHPSVFCTPGQNGFKPSAGMTLAVRF